MNLMRQGLFFLIATAALPSLAAEVFSANLGNYKVESCEFIDNEVVQSPDAQCKDSTEVRLAKDEKGLLQLTLKKSNGETQNLAIELYDRSTVEHLDTAKYEEYGDFRVWTHLQESRQNDEVLLKIERYIFEVDESKAVILTINKSAFTMGVKNHSYSHRYKLVKQP